MRGNPGNCTHTRLWREHIPGAELLNDDSPIIRATDSEALVHGSPWSGKTPCYRNESCPIAAVVRLSQASHNRIRRLRPIESIGRTAFGRHLRPALPADRTGSRLPPGVPARRGGGAARLPNGFQRRDAMILLPNQLFFAEVEALFICRCNVWGC